MHCFAGIRRLCREISLSLRRFKRLTQHSLMVAMRAFRPFSPAPATIIAGDFVDRGLIRTTVSVQAAAHSARPQEVIRDNRISLAVEVRAEG